MHLQKEGDCYLLTLNTGDRRPVIETCRELIGRIATNDTMHGEVVYTADDATAVEILARIAIHTSTKKAEPLPLSSQELHVLETAMGHFAPIEATKMAIDEEVKRSGVLSNPRIEARVDLGIRTAALLEELSDKKMALNDNAAANAFSA